MDAVDGIVFRNSFNRSAYLYHVILRKRKGRLSKSDLSFYLFSNENLCFELIMMNNAAIEQTAILKNAYRGD